MDIHTSCLNVSPSMLTAVAISIISVLILRVLYVLNGGYRKCQPASVQKNLSTLIVLGSGGHTAEMINLLNVLQKDRFTPRYYIAAATDTMSLEKARTLEKSWLDQGQVGAGSGSAYYMQIYRSREVGQSYITSVGTTLFAIAHALWLMVKIRPNVVLCNGPGTCIPLCMIAFLFKVLGIRWSSIFYVESIARVKRLSLSGMVLYKLHLADQLFVQWPQLKTKYPRAEYVGRLM